MRKLEPNYGSGAECYWREFGDFEVRYADGPKHFYRLKDAIKLYNQINDEAFIWDLTGRPELIEEKTWVGEEDD
jgi:hypothetical protein